MNDENLQPLNTKTKKEQRAIQSKGGSTKTPARKYAAQLREMKKRGELGDESVKKLTSMMTDPEFSILDKQKYIKMALDAVKQNAQYGGTNVKDLVAVAKLDLDIHKAHFGDKMKLEHSGEVNGNIGISFGVDTSSYLQSQIELNKKLKDNAEKDESECDDN